MNPFFRILSTILLLILGYQGMVESFRLLDRPSDLAVYEGIALLAVLAVIFPFALWRVWRRSL